MKKLLINFTRLYKLSDAGPITRRYFVIGVFDGALTVLGIILGAYLVHGGSESAATSGVIGTSIGGLIALGISSSWGAYEVEHLEQVRVKREKDLVMLTEINDSVHEQASHFAIIWGAFIHGIAPVIAGIIPILPFFFMDDFTTAVLTGGAIALATLFVTGFQMGRGAKASGIVYGFRLLFAGIVTALMIILLGIQH
ncbi:MAG: VIT1/CCC1 transporter family protein [Candidatus Hodarchaeales archaeon]